MSDQLMKRLAGAFFITVFVCYNIHAQEIPEDLRQRIGNTRQLSSIMAEVDAYYQNGKLSITPFSEEKEFESPYLFWKRWEVFYANRLNADGTIPENVTQLWWDGWIRYNKEHPEFTSANIQQNTSYGGWTSIGPTAITRYGAGYNSGLGRVNCIAFSPNNALVIYIGLPQGGIWRSSDGGTTWTVLSDDIPSVGISGIVVSHSNANTIYALTGDGDVSHGNLITSYGFDQKSIGVLKSIDGGTTWFLTAPFPDATGSYYGYKLIQHPTSSNTLFAATTAGIYKTTNGGGAWDRVSSLSDFTDIEFKPGDPTIMYAARRGVASPFLRSTNSGETWSTSGVTGISSSTQRIAIGVSPNDPDYVYVLSGPATADSSFRGLYRSTNSGQAFSTRCTQPNILGYPTAGNDNRHQTNYDLAIEVGRSNAEIVITGGINIWRSSNGGTTMTARTQWFDNANDNPPADYVHADIHNLAYNPLDGKLYSCSDGGVGVSSDNGLNWTFLPGSLQALATYRADWFEANTSVMASGTQDNGTNVRFQASNNYRHIYGADGFDCLINQSDQADIVFVANDDIRRTTDGGLTESNINPSGIGFFPQLARSYSDDNDIYAGDGNRVYRSTNRGGSWSSTTSAEGSRVLTTCQSNSSRIYAGTSSALYRSNDAAVTWTTISGTTGWPTGGAATDVEATPSNSLVIWASFGGYTDGAKVYTSSNGGDSWTNRSGSLPNVACHSIAVDNNNNVYVGTDIGVFVRPNGETDWQPFLNGLPRCPISELMVNNTAGIMMATTYGRGNWRTNLYSTCPASGTLNLTSNISGQRFYEYPIITSSSTLVGGVGTDVAMKGIDYVELKEGFQASDGHLFIGYTGPCGSGGVKIGQTDLGSTATPISAIALPISNTMQFPYGTIARVSSEDNSARLMIKEPGQYSLRTVDANGVPTGVVNASLLLNTGYFNVSLATSAHQGFGYLQLLKDDIIVHYQEFVR